MSKGATHTFLHGLKKPSDGHKDISTYPNTKYPMVYCPKIKDTIKSLPTSAGSMCGHCKKIYT